LLELQDLLVREVREVSQVQGAALDQMVHLVALEDKVQLEELEQLEVLGCLVQTDSRATPDK